MFNKLKVSKGSLDLYKTKLDNQSVKTNIAKFHYTGSYRARSNSKWDNWDYFTKIKIDNGSFNLSLKKVGEIENTIQEAEKSYIRSIETFKKALEHDCFYDVINQDDKNEIIAFLPFSTSNNKIFCGMEKFNKVHMFTNDLKNFYVTRLLFHKTMTKEDFIKWEVESKLWYQDMKFRKKLFNEIQKDLEVNSYSLLKDSDLLELNVEFFTNDLPKVKFKFTDLIE